MYLPKKEDSEVDIKDLPLDSVISYTMVYKDSVMSIFEKRYVCHSPIRGKDVCVEKIFIWN